MDDSSFKRKGNFADSPARKMAKTEGGSKKMSFAQRMMAKMGHKDGEGLGKTGEGILNPIEVNSARPAKVGVGAVKEMTKQAKEEAKRQAERRGEEFQDSSEEERKARQKRKAERAKSKVSGARPVKPKIKYQSAAEIEAAAEGLQVPTVLKTIIDATGPAARTLETTAGLLKSATPDEIEAQKLANRARRDLEAFASSWNELAERAKELHLQEDTASKLIEEEQENLAKFELLLRDVEQLIQFVESKSDQIESWTELSTSLDSLQRKYAQNVNPELLQQLCVAAIQPSFKQAMLNWDPLEDPVSMSKYLQPLQHILGLEKSQADDESSRKRSTTPYETLIYTLWLPNIRSTINNDWDPYDPSPMIAVIEAWKSLLPDFVADSVINTLIVKKLTTTLQSWNPRTSLKSKATLPHIWVFPWLPFLSHDHIDPKSTVGLLSEVNRKLRVVFDSWNIDQGLLPGIQQWVAPLGSSLINNLVKHLLPRLARYLSENLTIDPSEQDLTPLENVLLWKDLVPERALAQLFVHEFFPKWLTTLHQWLISDHPNFEEVATWYKWWREQIPTSLNDWRGLIEQWQKGLTMMTSALELGDQGKAQLAMPASRPSTKPIAIEKAKIIHEDPQISRSHQHQDQEASFKDAVEAWCEEENLILVPLREAHENGLPLFRITASVTGRGGILVYFKGDIVWAQKRGDKNTWEQVSLDQGLAQRAERR